VAAVAGCCSAARDRLDKYCVTGVSLSGDQEGNADAGRYQLETALDVLARQGNVPGAEAMAAGYHYKLAR
jgi:hypothetical protein